MHVVSSVLSHFRKLPSVDISGIWCTGNGPERQGTQTLITVERLAGDHSHSDYVSPMHYQFYSPSEGNLEGKVLIVVSEK